MGGPPRSAFRGGGPLGLCIVPTWSLQQAMGCSGRARRLALYLCVSDALLCPVLVCRAVVCHEEAHSRRPGTVGS